MLIPLFNATAFSQSKKENVLYDNLLRSINEYYGNYIIENHGRIDSTYIDLTGLPRGFNKDSLHSGNTICTKCKWLPPGLRKRDLTVIGSKYQLSNRTLRIVVYRDVYRKSLSESEAKDSVVHYYTLLGDRWLPSDNAEFTKDTLEDLLVFSINHLDSCWAQHYKHYTSPGNVNTLNLQRDFDTSRINMNSLNYLIKGELKTFRKSVPVEDIALKLSGNTFRIRFVGTSVRKKLKYIQIQVDLESDYYYEFKYDPNQKKWHLSDYHAYYDLFH